MCMHKANSRQALADGGGRRAGPDTRTLSRQRYLASNLVFVRTLFYFMLCCERIHQRPKLKEGKSDSRGKTLNMQRAHSLDSILSTGLPSLTLRPILSANIHVLHMVFAAGTVGITLASATRMP